MTIPKQAKRLVLPSIVILLGACSGGGGVNSTPLSPTVTTPPPVTPAPPPPPPPPPPVPPAPADLGPIGLRSDAPFAVVAANVGANATQPGAVTLSYRASDDRYLIELPGVAPGYLKIQGFNGGYDDQGWQSITGTWSRVVNSATGESQPGGVTLTLPTRYYRNPAERSPPATTYTSWGIWSSTNTYGTTGYFAYGIPTPAGDVPRTGTATYSAQVVGETPDQSYVDGVATLNFNFAAGTLDGSMKAYVCPWDCDIELPRFDFTQTVYATGSRTFSGRFAVPGSTEPSGFNGNFNGPGASEVMAQWFAPFLNPKGNQWEQMAGIWVGRVKP